MKSIVFAVMLVGSEGRVARGGARYQLECWREDNWVASLGGQGNHLATVDPQAMVSPGDIDLTLEELHTDNSDSYNQRTSRGHGNYRTTEGRRGFRGVKAGGQSGGSGARRGQFRGRGTPCLWEATYYMGQLGR